ncbi:hypothetical protein ACFPIJ_30755 [Dactylosporangium cerinum]|uniref:Integral membrane protein n=1 Tax=Dactylosporangium cerinum TaxID=1434730 RepID=A0ABV9W0P6_9ACTN
MSVPDPRREAEGWQALAHSAVAAAVFYPLATYGPGWWRGARLPYMDPPFDLAWLHDAFAWTAQYVGPVLTGAFGGMALLLLIVAAFTSGFRSESAAVGRVVSAGWSAPVLALFAVAALAVAWFALSQVAAFIAPFLGMYHGEIYPAVP